ncbi:hypothetical protein [Saezia sanguinis]|uniref:hypothetical protein n=1 Tax=Saezia sanguinis TaxID=1965230 RepID=UPI0030608F17
MSLLMNIFHGAPLNTSGLSLKERESLIDEEGHQFCQIGRIHFFAGHFCLFFNEAEFLQQAALATGWNVIDLPSSSNAQGLLIGADEGAVKCFRPDTREVLRYSDLYFASEKHNATIQMVMMVKKPYGECPLILNRIDDLTFVHGDYTVWFQNEADFQHAKKETGWKDGHDEFGLVLPLDAIHSAILFDA